MNTRKKSNQKKVEIMGIPEGAERFSLLRQIAEKQNIEKCLNVNGKASNVIECYRRKKICNRKNSVADSYFSFCLASETNFLKIYWIFFLENEAKIDYNRAISLRNREGYFKTALWFNTTWKSAEWT